MREELAARLKEARSTHFRSATEAASSLGVPYQTYAAHENGNRLYDVEDAILYARRFRVSLDWLLTGQGRGPGGVNAEAPIKGDVAVLSVLRRIEGLTDTDINIAFGVIQLAWAKQGGSAQAERNDQSEPANRLREEAPSR